MNKPFGRMFPRKRARPTLADKLADRMDAFYDACEVAITDPWRDKPAGPNAWPLSYGWFSPSDWIRHATYHRMLSLLEGSDVFSPSALSGDVRVRMCSLLAPYVMDDREFDDLLRAVPSVRQVELNGLRKAWHEALAAAPSPVRKSEATNAALARLHPVKDVRVAYELGRQALFQEASPQITPFYFLAPYAIARVRALARLGTVECTSAPPFDELADWDRQAVTFIHAALVSGNRIDDDMVDLIGWDEKPANMILAGQLKTLQNAACLHMLGESVPNPLPMDKPRDASSRAIDMFNDATLLARHCQLMGPN